MKTKQTMNRKLTIAEQSKVRLIGLALQKVLDVFEMMHNLIFRQKHKELTYHPRFKSLIRHKEAAAKHLFAMLADIRKMSGEPEDIALEDRPNAKKWFR